MNVSTSTLSHQESHVRALDGSRYEEAVELLANAFASAPVMETLYGLHGRNKLLRSRQLFRLFLSFQGELGQPILYVEEGDRLAGVALLYEPTCHLSKLQLGWMALRLLPICGLRATWRFWQLVRLEEQQVPDTPQYYLSFLAVGPECQGKGYGRLLLDAVRDRSESDRLSQGVFLETDEPSKVKLYQHFGYRIIGEACVDRVKLFLLFRPNAGDRN